MLELYQEEMGHAVLSDEWHGMYGEGWTGVIHPSSFQHPAKYSRALIRKIYDHVIKEGWAIKGSSVVDPFGGVALGGFDAMRHGLHWQGVELEMKFVGLGMLNILQWNERFSRMPNWGTARLLQGDSRKLAEVLSAAECCVSSPPYAGNEKSDYLMSEDGKTRRRDEGRGFKQGRGCFRGSEGAYGQSEGQLGAMKEGDYQSALVISSPPYLNGEKGHPSLGSVNNDDWGHDGRDITRRRGKTGEYGKTKGQLDAMPEGQLVITSPPYVDSVNAGDHGIDWSKVDAKSTGNRKRGETSKHGQTLRNHLAYTKDPDPANLGAMVPGDLKAAISSPPFPQPYTGGGGINVKGYSNEKQRKGSSEKPVDLVGQRTYQGKGGERSEGNLETMDAGGFDCAVSSPPFERGAEGNLRSDKFKDPKAFATAMQAKDGKNGRHGVTLQARIAQLEKQNARTYGDNPENIGNQSGETFWSASRLILEQLHQVIVPGGHAVFVTKRFVRDKKIVEFTDQWIQLCEAVGFRLVHRHKAMLVENYGTQGGFETDKKIQIARKSFFRRLAEARNSPAIDWEDVTCFVRPA